MDTGYLEQSEDGFCKIKSELLENGIPMMLYHDILIRIRPALATDVELYVDYYKNLTPTDSIEFKFKKDGITKVTFLSIGGMGGLRY